MTVRERFPELRSIKPGVFNLLRLLRAEGTAPLEANLGLFTYSFRRGSLELQRLLEFFVKIFQDVARGELPRGPQAAGGSVRMAFFRGDQEEGPAWDRRHVYIVLDRSKVPTRPHHHDDPTQQNWFEFHMGDATPIELTPHQILIAFWLEGPGY